MSIKQDFGFKKNKNLQDLQLNFKVHLNLFLYEPVCTGGYFEI